VNKIKMSEVRVKFPMYDNLSDDQLLIGLRQKFYQDIPPDKFYSRIEYDTGPRTTDEMSGLDRFRAGIGKAFFDLGRGAGQMVGAVSREDVKDSRRVDADLMSTGEGMAGNITGNLALVLPSALAPGAATIPVAAGIGAVSGFLQPSESTWETAKNTGMGGVAGAGGVVAGRALGAGYNATKSLFAPFTQRGQEGVAARTLQQFATDPAKAAANLRAARPLVPGSMPTMAQAADDAGLAQLERVLMNNPGTGSLIASQKAAQRTARLGAVQDVAGTQAYYEAIKDGVRTFAKQDYEAAIAAGFDPKALAANADKLAGLLARPSMQSAQATARQLAAETGEEITDLGSVRGLDYLVKALDNKISVAGNPGSSIGKAELSAMVNTKTELVSVLEKVAPAYKAARDNFAQMSKQVNSMDVARDLLKRMESPLGRFGADTREMKNAYAQALEAATENIKKQTGQNLPLSRVMPTKDVSALENVARDMARAAKADDMGRAVGSNTAQNLAAQDLLRRTLGPTGLPQSWAESTALQAILSPLTGITKLSGSESAIMNELARAALDPRRAAGLLTLSQQPSRLGLLGLESLRYAPAVGLLGNAPE
jgi:hypothetical protein